MAVESARYNHSYYGVPSWICIEFIFAKNNSLEAVQTWDHLEAYLKNQGQGQTLIEGHFLGRMTLASFYEKTLADIYGYEALAVFNYTSTNQTVLDRLNTLIGYCKDPQ